MNKKTILGGIMVIAILTIGYLGFTKFFSAPPNSDLPEQIVVEKEESSGLQEVGIMDSSKNTVDYVDTSHSNYLLYHKNEINLYNLDGELLDSDKVSKGDLGYEAFRDNGIRFSYKNKQNEYEAGKDFFYYLNKEKQDLYKFEINKDGFNDIDKYGVSEKNISKIYAYNEIIFYSNYSTTGKMFTNKYDIKRGDEVYKEVYFDQIDYKFDSIHTYIYVLNTGDIDTEYGKKELIEIPFRVRDWVANEKNIYFITDNYIGRYNLENNRIYLYNNLENIQDLHYSNNANGGIFGIVSKEDIQEGYIFKYDDRNLKVVGVSKFTGGKYLSSKISDDKLLVSLRIPSSEGGYRSENKVFDFNGNQVSSMTLRYVSTSLDISNNIIYSLNQFSNKYAVQLVNSTAKFLEKGRFTGISAVNLYYKDNYNYSEGGDLISVDRRLINRYGDLISEDGTLMGKNGFLLDNYGREVNKQTGLPVDKYGNIVDSEGNVLKYTEEHKTEEKKNTEQQQYMYDDQGNKIEIEVESNE